MIYGIKIQLEKCESALKELKHENKKRRRRGVATDAIDVNMPRVFPR